MEGDVAAVAYTPASGTAIGHYNNGAYDLATFNVMRGTTDVTANYSLAPADATAGKLTIKTPPLTVNADTHTKSYDGTALVATWSYSPSTATPTFLYKIKDHTGYWSEYSSTVPSITDADTITYLVRATANGYSVEDTATLTVHPVPLTIKADDATKVYGDADPALTATVTGKPEHGVAPVCHLSRAEGQNVGEYAISVAAVNPNYTITLLPGVFTITQRPVTVAVGDTTVEYNGAEHHGHADYVFDNVLPGHTATITYTPAKGRVVGEYSGTYGDDFHVQNGADVTVNYLLTTRTAGKLTVTGRTEKYAVTVMAKSDTVMYDGQLHTVKGFVDTVFQLNGHHYSVSGLTTSNPGSKNVCELVNEISGTAVVKDEHNNIVTDQFTVHTVNGKLKITPRPITLRSKPGLKLYDSTALVLNAQSDVIVEGAGFVQNEGAYYHITGSQRYVGMSYNVFTYTLNEGTLAQNYQIDTVYGTLTVKADTFALHIESRSENFVYDAQAHRRDEYRVVYKNVARDPVPGTNGLVFVLPTKDTLTIASTFNINNGITHVSENADSNNTFTYTLQHSDQYAGRRDTVYGTLKILPRNVVVRINGHAAIEQYNGQPQSVTGYDVDFIDTLYSASYIKYNGDSIATRQNVGTTMMNLQANDFVNQNNDFSPVTFNITDGEILITPDNSAAVILAGKHDMRDYDGHPHSVHGYEIVSITSNYSASDFEFTGTSGDSTATRTDAGTTWMGLSDTMFRNINLNFHDVTFILQSDGYQQINSIEATVKVTGHADIREYDGVEHVVTGYDLEISPGIYTANDFAFSGHDTAKRTNEGTSWMGLAENQFMNTNPNFNQVTFTITDGKQVIKPNSTALTLKCPSDTAKMYDGTPLSAAAMATSTIPGDAFVIQYKSKFEGEAAFSDWFDTVPSITDYGIKLVEVSCTNANYMPQSCTYTLSIHKRDVQLVSMDSTRMYNGDTLRCDSVKVMGDGFAIGEGATFQVTGGQLLPGHTPNTFTYTLNPGTKAANYDIRTAFGTLNVTERPESMLYPITVVAKSDTVTYDGYKHTVSGFDTLRFTTVDNHVYTVEGLTAEVSAYDAGLYENEVAGDVVVRDEEGNVVTDQFAVTEVDGRLYVTRRPVTITVPDGQHYSKVYDGDSLRVDYPNIHVSNLADRDTLTAGYIVTEGYTVGDYVCGEGEFMAAPGVASKHQFDITHGTVDGEYVAGSSLGNYIPGFQVTLTIGERPLELTAGSAEKVYDGLPLSLMEHDFTVTSGTSVAPTDTVVITHSGSQTCVGETGNVISSVVVRHKGDAVDVTSSYVIATVDGLLKVTPETGGFTCPDTLRITLTEGTYDTLVPDAQLGVAHHSLLEAGHATVTNDFAALNPLRAGAYTVTWTLRDACDSAMTTCGQTVVVDYTPCEGVVYNGHEYGAKRIGYQCWLTENLRTGSDAAGNPVADYHTFMDNTDNLHKFGYLYTWNSAVGVPENSTVVPQTLIGDDGQPFVQGICPAGWAVPTEADYSELQLFVGDAMLLKDAGEGYWIPGNGGTLPNSGFNARGGGFFNSTNNRYEGILSDYWAWTSDFNAGGVTATSANISYYCNAMTFVEANKTDRRSVRCVRKVYDGQ